MSKLFQIFFVFALFSASFTVFAQCPDWDKLVAYKNVAISDADRDRFGNMYVVGYFYSHDFTLGPYTFTLPSQGVGVYIAKFDKDFSLIWALSPHTDYRAFGTEIEVDSNDNIIVAGSFTNSISFECLTLQGSGRDDIFVVSYFADGTPAWALASTGVDDSNVAGLTLSPNGNIILISTFIEKSDVTAWLTAPDISIGGVPVITGSTDQVNAGYDSFIASIRADGTVLWTQGIGGDGNAYDYVNDVTTDSEDNVIVTGMFSSPEISFDGHIVHGFTVSENFFLAKLNSVGETQWVRETEGTGDLGGYGVETDDSDNIFVAGRFYGDAKFGSFNLPAFGYADVFVVKFNPDGTALNVRTFGNSEFDVGTQVEVDSHGRVVVSGYYYSDYFAIGGFSSSKPDKFPGHSFVATLSNDLNTVECASFVTGADDAIVWNMELDPFDNAFAFVDRMNLYPGPTNFGSLSVTGQDYYSILGILGNTPSTDEGETPPPAFPAFTLGKDSTLCVGEKLTLKVNQFCTAQYKWNTGSTNTSIEVTQAGTYWVDVTWKGTTKRDEVIVSYHEPISVSLGDDQLICPGSVVTLSLPIDDDVAYLWSDGGNSNTNAISAPGIYWVEVSNRCETVRETVAVQLKSPPVFDLGSDVVVCMGEGVNLSYNPSPGETLLWSDGSSAPTLHVTQSGKYTLAVNNGCIDTTDEVVVTIKGYGEILIPNVITHNGDGKNDHFLLPDGVEECSVLICNRWGEKIFYAPVYNNNWPEADLSSGVYFYTIRGDCVPESKGVIHLMP